ncbi:aconitate hydratase AcnA [Falsiroseomonas stagni]|uniref:Aconitate hydratase n=1 Tax=Falsiroseomonas stagni DSM 19981 TaxID=1123062 RepID=A0A1I4F0Z2_9PROT|nr:aconitate hydratase AcnA [Falsiroseomonas stagni]SFL10436.1 aconitate hydratase [Falsiroseomonas stagni DSM 19981]
MAVLVVGDRAYAIQALDPGLTRLPVSIKVLLENLLRHQDGESVTAADIAALSAWPDSGAGEIAYHPVRVLMPDSSGVPLLADLAAMRDAMVARGVPPERINPRIPVDLVIDHSVATDESGSPHAFARNLALEYERNAERYALIRWAQQAYDNFRVLPPGTGIVHQVNLEHLARPVWSMERDGEWHAFPDTLVGMDSHTPMVNALGVLGWGVGGIEAGAAMLGEPIFMPVPDVVGCCLVGALRPGVTATDLVLAVVQRLRAQGVVGKLVEFHGPGVAALPLPDRATIANMAPEYGATMGFFAIDAETIRFLRLTGRDEADIALAEAYAKAQGMWGSEREGVVFSDKVEIDLAAIEPALAGPKRPQDRRALRDVPSSLRQGFPQIAETPVPGLGANRPLQHGDVVIAAITSCTNTSNPAAMIGAALLARNAVRRGLRAKPWVKTSLSPGSRVVAEYLRDAGLQDSLDALGFHLTGFGCMTCAGFSGPLLDQAAVAIERDGLVAAAVLSSNRNFEGRIHPQVRATYIGSPALVVASAIAGSVLRDVESDPLGEDEDGAPVFLRDLWPDPAELAATLARFITADAFRRGYADTAGDPAWRAITGGSGPTFAWDPASTYILKPPFFDGAAPVSGDILGARALLLLGDGITTDHISPGGTIPRRGEVADYLRGIGVPDKDFSSFVARRVNHEVMLRGHFANPRIRNEMVEQEGGFARHEPSGDVATVFETARRYREEATPMIVVAGQDYGTGSSRDWAAKGTSLLGIRAIVAEGFERIHRSNLVGMGVLPLQFAAGVTRLTLGLDGTERFDLVGLADGLRPGLVVTLRVTRRHGEVVEATLLCRVDTLREVAWMRAGGVLHAALAGAT